MLYETEHLRLSADDGIATLQWAFPSYPVNALSTSRLTAIDRALQSLEFDPGVEILVLRSEHPGGFCGGFDPRELADLHSDCATAAFASTGQEILDRLADSNTTTKHTQHSPCLGPGLELALACDYRLAVASPTSAIGLPDAAFGLPTCWGGGIRAAERIGRRKTAEWLNSGRLLSAREAQAIGLVDHAFCERRAKIELRTFLDKLQANPRKRRTLWNPFACPRGERLAAERIEFRKALDRAEVREYLSDVLARTETHENSAHSVINPVPLFPHLTGIFGHDANAVHLATEIALRGSRVLLSVGTEDRLETTISAISESLASSVRRGRTTPLEADQSRKRIDARVDFTGIDQAGWVIALNCSTKALGFIELNLSPARLFCVPRNSHFESQRRAPRTVELGFADRQLITITPSATTHPDALVIAAEWLTQLGFVCAIEQGKGEIESPLPLLHAA